MRIGKTPYNVAIASAREEEEEVGRGGDGGPAEGKA